MVYPPPPRPPPPRPPPPRPLSPSPTSRRRRVMSVGRPDMPTFSLNLDGSCSPSPAPPPCVHVDQYADFFRPNCRLRHDVTPDHGQTDRIMNIDYRAVF